jgi:hypothetical protein
MGGRSTEVFRRGEENATEEASRGLAVAGTRVSSSLIEN